MVCCVLSSLRILIDTFNDTEVLSPVCIIVKDAKNTHVVQVRKRRLHQHPLLNSAVNCKVVDQAVDKGDLISAQVALFQQFRKSFFSGFGVQANQAADKYAQWLVPVLTLSDVRLISVVFG